MTCYCWGLEGHKSSDKGYKALGQTSRKCEGKDHYDRVFRNKKQGDSNSKPDEKVPRNQN